MIRRSLGLWPLTLAVCALAACSGDSASEGDAARDATPSDIVVDSYFTDARPTPDVHEAGRDVVTDAGDANPMMPDVGPEAAVDAAMDASMDGADDARVSDGSVVDVPADTGPHETNCADGVDDDSDGHTDCADSDCNGHSGCELPAERSCGDGQDNDADGRTDCADTDCSTTLACTHACPAGRTPLQVSATGLPLPITDNNTTLGLAMITGGGLVTSAVVGVDITHTDTFDLTLDLISPGGTTISLSNRHGSENFTGTVFTDSASRTIASGSSPYTGDFRPEAPLAGLLGQTAAGTWTLNVTDHAGGDQGTLDNFKLLLCVCGGATGRCELGTACVDGTDNDGDGQTDCADSDCSGSAGCEVTEMTCNDHIDNDADGQTDCADQNCDRRQGCEYATELTCGDLIDNDGDGQTDCTDSDCSSGVLCATETNCADRVDNDADGLTDCGDPGCAGVGGCEYRVEASCNDRRDNDGDGLVDCADSDCVNTPVCLAGCPTGTRATVYTALDDPQAIPDPGSAVSRATVPDLGVIIGLATRISVAHTRDSDLTLSLTSPSNTVANLAVHRGGTGDNFTSTVFTDLAPTAVTAGTAPFTGSYRPEAPLSRFIGELAAGQWRFTATDGTAGTAGTIRSFELIACVCSGTDGCEVGVACSNGSDDDGDGLADCADPDCNGVGYCEAPHEVSCTDTHDNDGDGLIDCHDPDCDGMAGCETGTERTCDDLRDNDQDGATDCADSDCASGAICAVESNCGNGIDDDADGKTDCADIGCNGMAACHFGSETQCTDGIDNDGDGQTDCTDADCQALELCTAGCPVGTTPVVYNSADLPAPIRDNQITSDVVTVSELGRVAGIAVRIGITHTADGDLNISLVSPSNTTVSLAARRGGSRDNYTGTLFIDSATTPIGSGTPPFTGSFQPETPLSAVSGQPTSGAWTLKVQDVAAGDTGTLDRYTLYLCVGP